MSHERGRRGPCLALLAALLSVSVVVDVVPARGRSFTDLLGTGFFAPVADALAQSVGRSIPIASASPGFVYSFDLAAGAAERKVVIVGQLFLETPDPIGKGQWSLGLNYERVHIDTIDGMDIDDLHDTRFPIVEPDGTRFTVPVFSMDLVAHQWTTSATLGVSENADINLTLPVLYSEFGVRTTFRDLGTGESARDDVNASALGPGDLLIRARQRLLQRDAMHLAAGLLLRLPTGNVDNFQGIGTVELAPMLYASTRSFRPWPWLSLQGYLNAGPNLNVEDVDDSEARYGVGFDLGIRDRLTIGTAFLGRYRFQRVGDPGALDVPRVDPATGQRLSLPLFGIRDERADYYDLSVGGRVNLWRDRLSAFANAIVSLNDDGVRADVIPLVGAEYTF